ncbi:MmpS family transport accessory protein [Streptomyces sp. NPDC002851]
MPSEGSEKAESDEKGEMNAKPEKVVESAESAESAESTESEESAGGTNGSDTAKRRSDGSRATLAIAAALLLLCGGFVAYGVFSTEDKPKAEPVPTAEVAYEVTGDGPADISYLAGNESGKATVVKGADLPWRKTVEVPLGKAPIVSIVLGEQGGKASCTLAIRGKHVQLATASGEFGRATCSGGELPTEAK